ncbi:MAG: ArgE/DapE family deacylase [Haloarculaceae archaeon]
MDFDRLDAAVDAREDELLDLLADLVERETVTGEEAPGQAVVEEVFGEFGDPDVWEPDAERLRDHEGFFETSTYEAVGYEGRPNVAVTIEGAGDGPHLTLSGHIDVVDVTEDEWERDPWTLTREGDAVYGRGSADMKGGVAAFVTAVRALRSEGVDLAGDLTLLSTIEEEDGGVGGTLSALERGYRPDAAVVAEPYDVPNVGTASAGVMYFRVTVPGESAHAAWGHEGVNAIGNAATVYEALADLDRERKARIDYPRAYRANPGLEGNVTNVNVGTIRSGDWPSTVPAEAVLEGRVGWPPGETREEVRAQIETAVASVTEDDDWLANHPPEVEWFGWQAAPHEVPEDAPIARCAKRHAEAATGETGQFTGGNAGLDERFYENYYDVHAVSVGPVGHDTHGADEHTTVSDLLATARTIARVAVDYCGTVD